MKFIKVVLLIIYFFLLNIPLATATNSTILFPSIQPKLFENYEPKTILDLIDRTNNQLKLNSQLQSQLQTEINKAQQELDRLNKVLSIKFTREIGLVYIHQGYDYWSIQFTYGGVLLSTSEEIILSTPEVFYLKQIFAQAQCLEIEGVKYKTTGFMRQLGPTLHE